MLARADHHERDARVGGERLDEPRVVLGDLLQRDPLLAGRQVDQPEAARDEHDRLGLAGGLVRAGFRERLPVGSERDGPLDRAAARRPRQRAPAHRRLLARVGERGAEIAPCLVDSGRRAHLAALERFADELLERLAVALPERRPLGLAVVGEDDEVVGARRLRGGALEPRELAVVLAQHGEGVRRADRPSGARPRRSRRTSRS